jgi:hypothetical protein
MTFFSNVNIYIPFLTLHFTGHNSNNKIWYKWMQKRRIQQWSLMILMLQALIMMVQHRCIGSPSEFNRSYVKGQFKTKDVTIGRRDDDMLIRKLRRFVFLPFCKTRNFVRALVHLVVSKLNSRSKGYGFKSRLNQYTRWKWGKSHAEINSCTQFWFNLKTKH